MGAAMTVEGLVDGAAFVAVVQAGLVSQRRPGQGVGCDHLKAHQGAGVREAMAAGAARRLSPPPDSPDFSPIEACWSTSEATLRTKAARRLASLQQAITSQDAQGWLTHAGYGVQSN